MYMRKPNPTSDKITKHVLEYLLTRFNLTAGDINNIRFIITQATHKHQIKPNLQDNKKKKNKGPID